MAEVKDQTATKDKSQVDNLYQAIKDIDDVSNGVKKAGKELQVGKISKSTIVSVTLSLIVAANTIALIFGFDWSLDENLAYQWGSVIAFIVNLAWATWKNHNFTKLARARTELVDELTK